MPHKELDDVSCDIAFIKPDYRKVRLMALLAYQNNLKQEQEFVQDCLGNLELWIEETQTTLQVANKNYEQAKIEFAPLQKIMWLYRDKQTISIDEIKQTYAQFSKKDSESLQSIMQLSGSINKQKKILITEIRPIWTKWALEVSNRELKVTAKARILRNVIQDADELRGQYLNTLEKIFNSIELTQEKIKLSSSSSQSEDNATQEDMENQITQFKTI